MKAITTAVLAATIGLSAISAQANTFSYHDSTTIERALTGNSVIGQLSDGGSYCEYHDPNSAVFGRDFEVYAGNWRVANNYICYTYPGYGQDCQRAFVNGNRITFMDADNGSMVSTGSIVSGNVCS